LYCRFLAAIKSITQQPNDLRFQVNEIGCKDSAAKAESLRACVDVVFLLTNASMLNFAASINISEKFPDAT